MPCSIYYVPAPDHGTTLRNKNLAWQWWHMPLIPAFARQKQENLYVFETSLVYKMSAGQSSKLYTETLFQKQKQKTKQKEEERKKN